MTPTDFRRIALSLEGVGEYSHAALPAFRVGGRKFASLASQAEGYGNLMFTLEQQTAFIEEAPEIFLPIPEGWGKMGHTHIRLGAPSEDVLAGALRTAWKLRVEMNARTRSHPLAAGDAAKKKRGKGILTCLVQHVRSSRALLIISGMSADLAAAERTHILCSATDNGLWGLRKESYLCREKQFLAAWTPSARRFKKSLCIRPAGANSVGGYYTAPQKVQSALFALKLAVNTNERNIGDGLSRRHYHRPDLPDLAADGAFSECIHVGVRPGGNRWSRSQMVSCSRIEHCGNAVDHCSDRICHRHSRHAACS
jgi:hypothetical protein